jgi:hypothetical protein
MTTVTTGIYQAMLEALPNESVTYDDDEGVVTVRAAVVFGKQRHARLTLYKGAITALMAIHDKVSWLPCDNYALLFEFDLTEPDSLDRLALAARRFFCHELGNERRVRGFIRVQQ